MPTLPRTPMTEAGALKALFARGGLIVAPGVFDMFSARLADRLDFAALYMTGYGVSGSHLGLPDAGLVTYTDMVGRAATIAQGTRRPLIADADTGFGGLLNIAHTVRGYERAGVQAIQIEDQEMPKRCGHQPGRRVVPTADMLRRLEVALAARSRSDFLIIARTDAASSHGFAEALERGRAFARAGVDMVMIEGVSSRDEIARAAEEIGAPLMTNMVPGTRTPMLPPAELERLGVRLAIYPVVGMAAACAAMHGSFVHLRKHGTSTGCEVPAFDMAAMNALVGFDEVHAFEKRFAEL